MLFVALLHNPSWFELFLNSISARQVKFQCSFVSQLLGVITPACWSAGVTAATSSNVPACIFFVLVLIFEIQHLNFLVSRSVQCAIHSFLASSSSSLVTVVANNNNKNDNDNDNESL
jgi:hypothetical protein